MSGGSWDHLYRREDVDAGAVAAMAERLAEEVPGSRAARDTQRLAELLRDGRLREVWRAVEWKDSNDSDEVTGAVAAYESSEVSADAVAAVIVTLPVGDIGGPTGVRMSRDADTIDGNLTVAVRLILNAARRAASAGVDVNEGIVMDGEQADRIVAYLRENPPGPFASLRISRDGEVIGGELGSAIVSIVSAALATGVVVQPTWVGPEGTR